MSDKPITQSDRPRKAIIGLLFVIAGVMFSAFAFWGFWPLVAGDGVDQFQGIERTVAQKAVATERMEDNNDPLPWFIRPGRAIEVRPITDAEKALYCKDNSSDDPNDERYYAVELRLQELFGFDSQVTTRYPCVFLRY